MKVEGVLGQIAAKVRERLVADRALVSEATLLSGARGAPLDFLAGFADDRAHVIAEIKLASPSEGEILSGANPVEVAAEYLGHGATALSILTERDFFKGSPLYLQRVRERFPHARLLMKDFVIDEYQLAVARHIGADAVLLIVALLGEERLTVLLARARQLGLAVLVEVHDEQELEIASRSGARLIGVNNRNLKTLQVDLAVSERLAPLAPRGAVLVSESGISSFADIARLKKSGYSAFLVGTSLMKTGKPGVALSKLLESEE